MGEQGQQTHISGDLSDPLSSSQGREQGAPSACFLPGPKQTVRIISKHSMSGSNYQETTHKNTTSNLSFLYLT